MRGCTRFCISPFFGMSVTSFRQINPCDQCQTYPLPPIQEDSHNGTFQAVTQRVRQASLSCDICSSVLFGLDHPGGIESVDCPPDIAGPQPASMSSIPNPIIRFIDNSDPNFFSYQKGQNIKTACGKAKDGGAPAFCRPAAYLLCYFFCSSPAFFGCSA
jgi:hypothetical protein